MRKAEEEGEGRYQEERVEGDSSGLYEKVLQTVVGV